MAVAEHGEVAPDVRVAQCLNRRIDALDEMRSEVVAWTARRDHIEATIDRQLATGDARIKLRRL